MNTPRIASVEVAVELYYSTFALYTADLRKLFPDASATTLSRLKRVAREYTISNGLMLIDSLSVPTDDAYKAWGLDIGMNELLILGLVLAVFTVVCAAVEAVENRDAIVAWLDREITAHYAARIAKRRVREAFRRAGGEPDAGRNRL